MLVLLASLAAAVAVAALVVASAEAPSPASGSTGAVTLVGDSLNVGIEPYLPGALEGWTIHNRNLVGRPTGEGLEVLRSEGEKLSPHVVISLGTNDGPGDVAGFRRSVREALAIAGPGRCVVWVDLAVAGRSFQGFNAVLAEEAARSERLRVVQWSDMLAEHPEWLAADGVHGTETGYEQRAQAVAEAVRDCRPRPELRTAP
jgi:lysophospholipase L1-like esterase